MTLSEYLHYRSLIDKTFHIDKSLTQNLSGEELTKLLFSFCDPIEVKRLIIAYRSYCKRYGKEAENITL